MYFCFFFIIFPRKSPGPSFEQTLISFTQGCFVPSLVEIGPLVLDFQNSFMYFRYFVIISPWKRAWPFIWLNSNLLHPRMLCAKFGWNWSRGSGEEEENVKSLQRQRRQTADKLWSEKPIWAFGSGELKLIRYLVTMSYNYLVISI